MPEIEWLIAAEQRYQDLARRCQNFDNETTDLRRQWDQEIRHRLNDRKVLRQQLLNEKLVASHQLEELKRHADGAQPIAPAEAAVIATMPAPAIEAAQHAVPEEAIELEAADASTGPAPVAELIASGDTGSDQAPTVAADTVLFGRSLSEWATLSDRQILAQPKIGKAGLRQIRDAQQAAGL